MHWCSEQVHTGSVSQGKIRVLKTVQIMGWCADRWAVTKKEKGCGERKLEVRRKCDRSLKTERACWYPSFFDVNFFYRLLMTTPMLIASDSVSLASCSQYVTRRSTFVTASMRSPLNDVGSTSTSLATAVAFETWFAPPEEKATSIQRLQLSSLAEEVPDEPRVMGGADEEPTH